MHEGKKASFMLYTVNMVEAHFTSHIRTRTSR